MKKRKDSRKHIIIAIDGLSASGKGSVAKLIAKEYNLVYLDTGLLYRHIGYKMLELKVEANNSKIFEQEAINIAKNLDLNSIYNVDLSKEEIATMASKVAKIPKVRQTLVKLQQDFAINVGDKNGAILDGRDIGTNICPRADLKIFITASLKVRALRRYQQLNTIENPILPVADLSTITKMIQERDERDKELNNLALHTKDYIIIDNSQLDLAATVSYIQPYINNILNIQNSMETVIKSN